MLRISVIESPDQAVTFRLEGRLVGPWVGELRRSCDRVLTPGGRLTLDLTGVSFIDGDGIALVQSLGGRRVALRNCSPFVAEQLRATTGATAAEGSRVPEGGGRGPCRSSQS